MKRLLLRTLICWLCLASLMVLSIPTKLPVVLLIVPFFLLFAAAYGTWLLGARLLTRLYGKQLSPKGRRLGMIVCGALILLLTLQSLGQLTVRDSLIVGTIALLGYLYSLRARRSDLAR